jgi:cytochrome c oxidase subunit II
MRFPFVNIMLDLMSRLFPSLSEDAYDINILFIRYLIFSAFIVLLIAGTIIIASIKFRAKAKEEEPKQVFGHKNLEIVWTLLPLIVVTIFFILTLNTMKKINKPVPKDYKPDIVVIAKQWWWDMRYPKYNVITANELHIPVGKRLLMQMESADVIHDWWVQDLGPKIDAIPGHSNFTWISAQTPGIYEGTCSEYCGIQHAWMRIRVVAQKQEDFDKWVQDQQRMPEIADDSIAQEGAMLFMKKTCMNCHSVTADPAKAKLGPDLSHIGSRQVILSGMKTNTTENLANWLTNPQKVKEGALMPDFMLTKDEVTALVTYLEGLK